MMKAALFFIVVAALALGLILFDIWLASDSKTHVMHVHFPNQMK